MGRFKLFLPLIALVVLLPLFYVGLKLDPTAMPSALVGNSVPEYSLSLVSNEQQSASNEDLKGQVTLLNVWATWCFACKAEHPYLNKLSQQGVNIVGVNYKDDRNAAKKWLRELHDPYLYSLYDNEGRLGLELGVTGAPETYLIDSEGVVRYRHIGVVDERVWSQILKPLYEQFTATASN
ncbi:DsbE family thiol:disulfide interchange protein [Gilvimarinus sp. SDUM040013]|uniref:DsbE family thiol:disulfide interchange protein n=1 Tax=Gilvimarinus gilvus TaxID=3058038 RepID=A0ABU4S264_9GAMM|nr:DsbE family thiol:disulfide interchange protein [Gilvimarinus sp. SDUM040013]MDO3385582.1 DsbE family thiol:disulfide interchange protein [Gilvimarinus sp. SDUM040013]MDX6851167.1 DsbE family thiol:disulfide interchange protein [Gilvimarinus sp. SDUM040013]